MTSYPAHPTTTLKYWKYQRPYYDRNLARGLTATGRPRRRPWQHLTGLTPEQKHARRKAQQLAFMRQTRAARLRTQDSGLRTQDSGLRTQDPRL